MNDKMLNQYLTATGKYKIELRNARTKKIQDVIKGGNAITLGVGWANHCRQKSEGNSSTGYGASGVGSIQNASATASPNRVTTRRITLTVDCSTGST